MTTTPDRFLLPLALLSLVAPAVQADQFDTLQFRVGQSVEHESNVLRLSDLANTQALLGSSERADTIYVTTVGVKLDKSYGLQRFELDVSADDYNYARYSQLDFTATNYAAAWRWSLTPFLHGNLTTDRREYVDNRADVQYFGQLNHRIDRSTVFDAEYELGGAWRLLGGTFNRTSTSSEPFTYEGDTKITGLEAGVRYVFPSAASLAYRIRRGDGEYPDRTRSTLFSSNFRDTEHELRLDWAPTGKSTVDARVSHIDRTHDGIPARDFSGMTGQLAGTWMITPKTSIRAGIARQLGSYQTADSSYFKDWRVFVGPMWKPTEKTAVRIRYDRVERTFGGPLPGFVASSRKDAGELVSLAFDWQPSRALKLTASLQRDKRNSTDPGFDYKSNSVGLMALFSF